jgi:hypothetical protein
MPRARRPAAAIDEAYLQKWWALLAEHPTLPADCAWAHEQYRASGSPGLGDPHADRLLAWLLRTYPGLSSRTPALSADALAFALGAVLEHGHWGAGLAELLQRTRWGIAPIEAEVLRTVRHASTAPATPPSRGAAPPYQTTLERTEHLWANSERMITDNPPPLPTIILRGWPGSSRQAYRDALEDALNACRELGDEPLGRHPRHRPADYRLLMDRYKDWWSWDEAERAAGREPLLRRFAMERSEAAASDDATALRLWSVSNAAVERAERIARQWLGRQTHERDPRTGKRKPIMPPARPLTFSEVDPET